MLVIREVDNCRICCFVIGTIPSCTAITLGERQERRKKTNKHRQHFKLLLFFFYPSGRLRCSLANQQDHLDSLDGLKETDHTHFQGHRVSYSLLVEACGKSQL